MFSSTTYMERRNALKQQMGDKGLVFIFGNEESPMNYTDNTYAFRQDSNFLYFTGLQQAHLLLAIDLATGEETLYGDELSMDHIIWMGPQTSLAEQAAGIGISKVLPFNKGLDLIRQSHQESTPIHYLPPYRADRRILLADLLSTTPQAVAQQASEALIKTVIKLRSYKSAEELVELGKAVNITKAMHLAAMKSIKAGQTEAYIAGIVEGIAIGGGGRLAYPCIGTKNGHILHNHYHGNTLAEGDLFLLDAGASSVSQYAGDITRTFPVATTFSQQQKEIYNIVLAAQEAAIQMLKAGVRFLDVHLTSATVIAEGLKALGLMKGDTQAAVAAGAHALFFPHGLGHMIGLDVHDMEDLGENLVGYDKHTQRSTQFGLNALRLGKELEAGFVLTVEPGLYFIPALIDQWQAENKHSDFICYDKLAAYRNFGGIRIEDNIHITADGYQILGDPIAKSVQDIEALR